MQGAKKLATYDDLLALPEDVKAEVIHGVLVNPPAPLPRHSSVHRKLGHYLGGPFDDDDGAGGPGGWWILLEVDVRLGLHDVVRPDLAGWRREVEVDVRLGLHDVVRPDLASWRRERLPEPWDTRPIDVVPNWICEIVSPSNAGIDRVTKRQLYARAGVGHYWIADPAARTLETYRLDPATRVWVDAGAFDASASARIAPFEAVELELARVFPPAPKEP